MEEDIGDRVTSVTKITAITMGIYALTYIPVIDFVNELDEDSGILDPVRNFLCLQFLILFFGSFLLFSTMSSQEEESEDSQTENSSPVGSEDSQTENSSPVGGMSERAKGNLFAIFLGILFGLIIIAVIQT